jgi:hypothetical protein
MVIYLNSSSSGEKEKHVSFVTVMTELASFCLSNNGEQPNSI